MSIIEGFYQTDRGHYFAQLSCGHDQRIVNRPPYKANIWVTNEAERQLRLGAALALPGVPSMIVYGFECLSLAGAAAAASWAHKEPEGALRLVFLALALALAWQAGRWAGAREILKAIGDGA